MDALKAPNLNEKLLADFECVVCTEYMHPPIVQCIEGHSVCNECHRKLRRCPTCRQKFDVHCRPLVLERLHGKLLFPCKHYERGCTERRRGGEIQQHERTCQHAPTESDDCLRQDPSPSDRPVFHYLSLLEDLADLYIVD